ncbi:penicillin-binding transpeptidase domain-containing protein, partial [Neisseria sp. P0015.S004]
IMYKIMQDVVRVGTARGAAALGRSDIAGKTGTTNDNKDAWFVGFTPSVVTAVYIGFDKPRSMGSAGYGGTIAVPVWVEYMRFALKGTSVKPMKAPEGVVTNGGEVYMRERMTTSSDLALDNSGVAPRPAQPARHAVPNENRRSAESNTAPAREESDETPVLPSNTGNNNIQQLDSLF